MNLKSMCVAGFFASVPAGLVWVGLERGGVRSVRVDYGLELHNCAYQGNQMCCKLCRLEATSFISQCAGQGVALCVLCAH